MWFVTVVGVRKVMRAKEDNHTTHTRTTPPLPHAQRSSIKEALQHNLRTGDTWYLIDARWYRHWTLYVQWDEEGGATGAPAAADEPSQPPGPIDNSELMAGPSAAAVPPKLKRLQEGEDYVLVPRPAWELLHQWYSGGPEIPRMVIEEGISKKKRVEVYPLSLRLAPAMSNSSNLPSEIEITISKVATVQQVCTRGKGVLRVAVKGRSRC